VRISCKSTELPRCRGTITASLTTAPRAAARRATTSYSIARGRSRTVRVALSRADVRRIRGLSARALSTRRLRVVATSRHGSLRFRQTTLVRLSRR
jgi:hypothetical protein